jgi:hypothetical protein
MNSNSHQFICESYITRLCPMGLRRFAIENSFSIHRGRGIISPGKCSSLHSTVEVLFPRGNALGYISQSRHHFPEEMDLPIQRARSTISPGKCPWLYITVKASFPRGNRSSYTTCSKHYFPGEMPPPTFCGRDPISPGKNGINTEPK